MASLRVPDGLLVLCGGMPIWSLLHCVGLTTGPAVAGICVLVICSLWLMSQTVRNIAVVLLICMLSY